MVFERKTFAYRWLVGGMGLLAAIALVPGVHYRGGVAGFVALAVIFGLINALLKPILTFLTCPLVLVSLGLFLLVINALLLWLTARLGRSLGIEFYLDGFGPAFWGGIVISAVSLAAALFLREK